VGVRLHPSTKIAKKNGWGLIQKSLQFRYDRNESNHIFRHDLGTRDELC
jgi:hypothetical protein